MKPSDVGQRIHSYKQGSYKWDLVRFNHTSHEIIMTNIRDDLMFADSNSKPIVLVYQNWIPEEAGVFIGREFQDKVLQQFVSKIIKCG